MVNTHDLFTFTLHYVNLPYMITTVINIKNAPIGWINNPDYVYIGRAGKGLTGYFGNPTTLKKYRGYLESRIDEDIGFREKVMNLYGKTLVCFCKPKPCHGDILAEYAERLWLNNIK